MPINKIRATGRAKAAIAAVMSVATSIGGVWYVAKPGEAPVPAAVVLAADSLVKPWEGRELRAYRDIVGVLTICDGDTENVRPGMVETPAGCDKRLQKRLNRDFYPGMQACILGFETKPVSWQAMMISLSYNVGTAAACGSTAARFGRAGEYFNSCITATRFNKAGGRLVVGLVNRREMGDRTRLGEAELCISGL